MLKKMCMLTPPLWSDDTELAFSHGEGDLVGSELGIKVEPLLIPFVISASTQKLLEGESLGRQPLL